MNELSSASLGAGLEILSVERVGPIGRQLELDPVYVYTYCLERKRRYNRRIRLFWCANPRRFSR